MKKLIFFINVAFIIASIILILFLIYIGFTRGLSATVIISIIVMLCVGIHSAIAIVKEKK